MYFVLKQTPQSLGMLFSKLIFSIDLQIVKNLNTGFRKLKINFDNQLRLQFVKLENFTSVHTRVKANVYDSKMTLKNFTEQY